MPLSMRNTWGSTRNWMALTLSTIYYTCHSLRLVYSEITGRVTGSWDSIWGMCSLNPHPTKTHLAKSLNWGMYAQFGAMDPFAVLSLVGHPLLGAVTNGITWTSGPQENCRRAASTSSTWEWPPQVNDTHPEIPQKRIVLFAFVRSQNIWKHLNWNEKYSNYFCI